MQKLNYSDKILNFYLSLQKTYPMKINLLNRLIVLLMLSNMIAIAQPTITYSGIGPSVGESTVFRTDTSSIFNPGSAGINQTWDLTYLQPNLYGLSTYVNPSTTAAYLSFPSANIATTSTQGDGYMNITANAMQYYGVAFSGIIMSYDDPEDLIHFPFSYNNTYTDTWSTVFTNGGYTFYRSGTTTVTADGYGTLITPTGTYQNVLRVHSVQVYQDSTFLAGPFILNYSSDQYSWYANGIHPQIANLFYSSSATISQTGGSYLESFTGISEPKQTISSLNVSPNPSVDNIQIDFTLSENMNVDVVVFNLLGEKMMSVPCDNSISQSVSVRINDLADGIYFAKIVSDENVFASKMFVVAR